MTKKLFALLLLLISFSGFSQQRKEKQEDPVPYEVRYKKLKELHIKMLDSDSQKAADSLFQLFVYKITPDVGFEDIYEENQDIIGWTKANIGKTEFKTIAEAEKLWDEYEQAINMSTTENKDYYTYLLEAFQYKDGIDMNLKVMEDVEEEFPEKSKSIKLPERKNKSDFYPKLPGQ